MINPLSLKNRRYLITGAASCMRRATSILLSSLGAELILVDVNEEGLRNVSKELENKSFVLPLDLSDIQSIKPRVENVVS